VLELSDKAVIWRLSGADSYTQVLHTPNLSGAIMSKQTYLHKREKSAVYYFRCRIPNDLLSHYDNKREIIYSLKTRDHHEAMRRVSIEAGKQQTEFEALRRTLVNTQKSPKQLVYSDAEIERLSLLWTHCVLETDDRQRLDGYPDESFEEQAERLTDTEQHLKQIYARGELEKIYPALNGFLVLVRVQPPDDPVIYRHLAMSFLKAALQATKLQLARHNGDVVETELIAPANKVYVEHIAQPINEELSRLDLAQLLQNWHEAIPNRAASTVDAYTSAIKEFKVWIKGVSADKVTRQNIIGFRDYLLKERAQHNKTVEKKIGILCSILQLAVDDELLPSNPAMRIKVPKPKHAPKARIPYSEQDMQQIFNSALYTSSESDLPLGGKGAAAKWLPVLAMYTGARLEEIAQLHVADIKQDSQHGWYFDITDVATQEDDSQTTLTDASPKRLKTESSRRRVPVHPKLQQIGFIHFVKRCRAAGNERLFPQLVPDSKGAYSGSWSKWWSRYARQVIGINNSKKVFHSFRHAFKDACREAGISEEISDALSGHTGGGVGRTYGNDQYPLGPLVRAMVLIEYRNVTIPIIEQGSDIAE
jgi:integrase